MRQKSNVNLLPLLLIIFLIFGCNMLKKKDSTVTSNTNTTSPTPTATPTLSDLLFDFRSKDDELGKFTAPVKLDSKAKIKGKVAIVEGEGDYYELQGVDSTDFNEEILKEYGLTKANAAAKVEEIDTLVQTKCAKGRQIGNYRITDGRTIPAYALKCETLVFDYKKPVVFAKKSFISEELSENIEVGKSTTERTAYTPTEQIKKFVKSLVAK